MALVTIIENATQADAALTRVQLEAAGIRVIETNQAAESLEQGTALGGVRLMVDEENYERAVAVLSAASAGEPNPVDHWTCPACGKKVEGTFQVCWACGTAADGTRDPDFHADVEDEDDDDEDEDWEDAPPVEPPAASLVTIIEDATQVDASLARVHLEAAGIRVIETNQASESLGLGTALGGVRLMVDEENYDRAAAVLLAATAGEAVPVDNWTCPACGEEVMGTFQVCWACGTAADGTRDPDFQADVEDEEEDEDEEREDAPLGRLVEDEPPAARLGPAPDPAEENPYRSPGVPGAAAAPGSPAEGGSGADALATRAFRAAVLGLLFAAACPLFNVYSAWLLILVALEEEQLSPFASRRFYYAWGVNLLSLLVFSWYLNFVLWLT